MTTVRVSVRVRKYLWSDFVHDVCFVLYATLIISNALSKRYLRLSLRELYHRIHGPISRFSGKAHEIIHKTLLIVVLMLLGFLALAYAIMVPAAVILGALGKIQ